MVRQSKDTVLGERGDIKSISQKRHWILTLLHLNLFFPFWTAASENDTTHCFWPICKCNLNVQKLFLKFKSVVDIFFSQLQLHFTNKCHSMLLEQPCFMKEIGRTIMLSNLSNSDAKIKKFLCVSMKPHDKNCQGHSRHNLYTCQHSDWQGTVFSSPVNILNRQRRG